jgi:hypothetical protein
MSMPAPDPRRQVVFVSGAPGAGAQYDAPSASAR